MAGFRGAEIIVFVIVVSFAITLFFYFDKTLGNGFCNISSDYLRDVVLSMHFL
jgi:hypothetical protein